MTRRYMHTGKGFRLSFSLLWGLLLLLAVLPAVAQRRIMPVNLGAHSLVGKNENKQATDSIDRSKLVESLDADGNKIYVDTVSGKEVTDSLPGPEEGRVPKMINPLLYSASIGVDIWDPIMRIFGQKYGLIGFSAELNLHNRYIPVFEAGLGNADNTPTHQNYTYHVGVTPYFRVGVNYNFLYNSNPDYQFVAGLRFGWTHFNYQLRSVEITDPYWGTAQVVDFPRQTSNVTYLNVLFGLRVKIWKQLSMGWHIRIRTILHETDQPSGQPWYIPGYGSRNGLITGSFSVFYTFSLVKKKAAAELPAGLELDPAVPEPLPKPEAAAPEVETPAEVPAAPAEASAEEPAAQETEAPAVPVEAPAAE